MPSKDRGTAIVGLDRQHEFNNLVEHRWRSKRPWMHSEIAALSTNQNTKIPMASKG